MKGRGERCGSWDQDCERTVYFSFQLNPFLIDYKLFTTCISFWRRHKLYALVSERICHPLKLLLGVLKLERELTFNGQSFYIANQHIRVYPTEIAESRFLIEKKCLGLFYLTFWLVTFSKTYINNLDSLRRFFGVMP